MDFSQLLQQGTAHAWLYVPVAIVLGALHGLEPGHSKTMMAAFIIAIRGTVWQAALLGFCAALSHTLIIWLLAGLALKYGSHWNVEQTEPYFLLISGLIVVGMAVWTIMRLREEQGHAHHHHHHHDESKSLKTADGELTLDIFEDGMPPVFRVAFPAQPGLTPVSVRTLREDGTEQVFRFVAKEGYWESDAAIPEPHAFNAEATVRGPSGETVIALVYAEADHHHDHDDLEDEDAHARAHAEEIRQRFANRQVTTGQIVLFGLTGGLMPCPAAVSILIVCLQVKQFSLGFGIVAAFSFGLALTMISVGVLASWGFKKLAEKSGWFSRVAHRAPYVSSYLLIALGLAFAWRGLAMMK
ncbi:MAG: sulfite exporter TauE/SafE family protein [Opitutales bacterium]